MKDIISLLIVIIVFSACGKIDNYDQPDGSIYGKLTDKITNETLQTEQPNGFTIKLFEKGGQEYLPITFYGKPDGTYENAWIFQNEYKVLVTEGAFFPVDTLKIKVGSRTEANFVVTPFLAVSNVVITPSIGKVTANYKIVRSIAGDKIVECKTLVSEVPTVNNIVYKFKSENSLIDTSDDAVLATSFTDVVSGLTSNKTYYVRIAVRTDNALKRYNYSKVFTVTIP